MPPVAMPTPTAIEAIHICFDACLALGFGGRAQHKQQTPPQPNVAPWAKPSRKRVFPPHSAIDSSLLHNDLL